MSVGDAARVDYIARDIPQRGDDDGPREGPRCAAGRIVKLDVQGELHGKQGLEGENSVRGSKHVADGIGGKRGP